jgi:hypothetical protein
MGGHCRCSPVSASNLHFDGPLSTKTSDPYQDTYLLKIVVEESSSISSKAKGALSHALLGTHEGNMYVLDGAYSAHAGAAMQRDSSIVY